MSRSDRRRPSAPGSTAKRCASATVSGTTLCAVPPALDFDASGALALARCLELGDRHGAVELADGAENLAHEHGGWRVGKERIRRGCRHEGNAESLKEGVPSLLHHEVAGETVGALDNDGPYAVASDQAQHVGEAGPGVHGIGTRNRSIIKRSNNDEAGTLGVALDH
jgi:hypothetical protein